ncbi:glycosyltransferase family 2 protein [Parazoarcus communis]|uniref:Glycosyltransferase n=1 Tax=Parazoarcus communis SWub3 = DSM 12120 TaxID=1121029 RepID=A0A323V704_9RHOO|nr:glycosyltransferase family 2 protein [Parazoarcus communis]NMG71434.1 glycosyltransferase [Parazoarcus communis SWub3 = DSM 12120]PZA15898.1 glycosyltransferase [Azoarcus communis] [Parazoarcus communis SWub3 = DSM 12120]
MNKSPLPHAEPQIPDGLPEHTLSVVVPMYNEAENVEPLLDRIHLALGPYPWPWEVVLVDDGSSDATPAELARCATQFGPHVRVVELMRNFKQTAAMQAGLDAARGSVIVTMDGDLQNDPIDIPRMVKRLLTEDLDLVAGWRKDRQDGLLLRKIPSRIANRLIARLTGVHLRDYGCSLKVFRGSAIKNVRLYGEMHRFIPAWLATVTTPRRIAQEVVTHHARVFGQSKYGISRTFRVVLDLIFVYFFMRFRTRPGHFFGGIGIGLGAMGGLILTYLAAVKLFLGESIGTRPLLFGGFFLVIAGVQMVTSGVLAELLARVYYESGTSRPYLARPVADLAEDDGWRKPGTST